jgi:SAM-dependent methyltransferase
MSLVKNMIKRGLIPLRRRYYTTGVSAVVILPRAVRDKLGFDDATARGSRKIEIGGGPYAQSGYLHVDIDPSARHLEALAEAWDLPFPDGWATEILSIHQLEHVHPTQLIPTLREWRRVLEPHGIVRIHVPNGPALMEAFNKSSVDEKWPIMGSLLGMYCSPELRRPEGLTVRSDHQIIFDRPVLRWALNEAGFERITDLTDSADDRHVNGWRQLVDDYSIVMTAAKP